jgi:outer membrane protein OmpA-like peptidoglycan-associated protein
MRLGVCAVMFLFVVGCNHEKTATATPARTPQSTGPSEPAPHPRDLTKNQKMSHSLALSSDIVALCGLNPTGSAAVPTFDYDKDQLTDDDHNVLQQLATCIMRGPLQGKDVELIGRADARGTEEYNLALGSRRASSVSQYLEALGVNKTYLSRTSRGALDATGTDAAGWAKDRRVDIMLKRS